jgi:hypothetical protein
MGTLIYSAEIIKQLKINDIIFHPEKKDNYLIESVCEDCLILKHDNEHRLSKSVRFFELIRDKWELQ